MLSDLAWLPKPLGDWRQRYRAVRAALDTGVAEDFGQSLQALATASLDEGQLNRLGELVARIVATGQTLQPLTPVRIGIVGDGTLSLIGPAIAGSGLRHGLLLDVVIGEYNSAIPEAMDPDSEVRAGGLDLALIVSDYRSLGLDRAQATAEGAAAQVAAAFERIRMIVEGFRPSVAGAILIQTIVPPLEPLFGSFDSVSPTAPYAMVAALNLRLAVWAQGDGSVVLVDAARAAATAGLEQWHDPRHWHASKLAVTPAMTPLYADLVARIVAAIRGKARKCLVLDLDNTLWGGVIGDDGLTGIALGQGSAEGEAFLSIQQLALALRERGVVLAVCSKNEDDAARLPFREHPDMLLREEHIAVFQANWTDKATNLRAIAEALNIGVDALVFLDDNPAEREQVRRELPMVAVPELPGDPALYPRMLAAAGYFEAIAFSEEDRARAGYYQANAERAAIQASSSDMGSYLASLDMICTIGPVDPVTRPRVAQLINKSNQFNLTTRRYTEAEVAAIEADAARHAIQIRLVDCFGDNGLISVIIADKARDAWTIDTWLMSCRVLGRRVEDAVLNHLSAAARAAGATRLIGRYVPSAKNRMVEGHYAKLGFTEIAREADGTTTWSLDLTTREAPTLPMRIDDILLSRLEAAA